MSSSKLRKIVNGDAFALVELASELTADCTKGQAPRNLKHLFQTKFLKSWCLRLTNVYFFEKNLQTGGSSLYQHQSYPIEVTNIVLFLWQRCAFSLLVNSGGGGGDGMCNVVPRNTSSRHDIPWWYRSNNEMS